MRLERHGASARWWHGLYVEGIRISPMSLELDGSGNKSVDDAFQCVLEGVDNFI